MALACIVGVLVLFHVALALGMPWGAAAWGGGNDGVLPPQLRMASGLAAVLWGWVALVVAGRFLGAVGQRRVLLALGVLSLVAIAMNLASPSAIERVIWAPFAAVMGVMTWACWWRARGDSDGAAPEPRT